MKSSDHRESIQQFSKQLRVIVLTAVILAGGHGMASTAAAQELQDLRTTKSPLVLKALGSFFVPGEFVEQTAAEVGLDLFGISGDDELAINQMYVQYMVPAGRTKVPVVLIHGGTLSGKGYETQPDGRMGWGEYFVRKGHSVYIVDQISRGRSGFNQAVYNNVRVGTVPSNAQPPMLRLGNRSSWVLFRFGPAPGIPFPNTQFPVESMKEFAMQNIPDLNFGLPSPNPTPKALSKLAHQLKGAVLVGHSESGTFPLEAALINATATRGLVVMEPGGCNATTYTDQQIKALATVPILVVFGDHLDVPNPILNWQDQFNDCQTFIVRVNASGGNAQMLYPPALGIFGNSHMLMNDKNSNQIAELIRKWIDQNVGKKYRRH